MAAPCQSWQAVRLNAFSNPDVNYLYEPIGTTTQDNAVIIESNAVSLRFIDDSEGLLRLREVPGNVPPTELGGFVSHCQ